MVDSARRSSLFLSDQILEAVSVWYKIVLIRDAVRVPEGSNSSLGSGEESSGLFLDGWRRGFFREGGVISCSTTPRW